MTQKKFHRHFPTKGLNLYWIIIAYLVIGAFYPIIGWIAIICMVAPVAFSVKRGRWWCGNACPRGNFFDRVLSRYSPHRPIPAFVRSRGWRIFMVAFIFTMFGVQMYYAWGNWAAMGAVFWRIILLTTIVAVVLAFIYAPRTWCSFCPMGTLSSWVTPKTDTFLMVTVALRSVIIALRNVRCAPAFALCNSTPTRLVAMERASTILTASNAVNALCLAQCGLASINTFRA